MPGPIVPEEHKFHVVPMAESSMDRTVRTLGGPKRFDVVKPSQWSHQTQRDHNEGGKFQFGVIHGDRSEMYLVKEEGGDGVGRYPKPTLYQGDEFPFANHLSDILGQNGRSLKSAFASGLAELSDDGDNRLGRRIDGRSLLNATADFGATDPYVYLIDGEASPYTVTRVFWDNALACFYVQQDRVTIEREGPQAAATVEPITRFMMSPDSAEVGITPLRLFAPLATPDQDAIQAAQETLLNHRNGINAFFQACDQTVPAIPEAFDSTVQGALGLGEFVDQSTKSLTAYVRAYVGKQMTFLEEKVREALNAIADLPGEGALDGLGVHPDLLQKLTDKEITTADGLRALGQGRVVQLISQSWHDRAFFSLRDGVFENILSNTAFLQLCQLAGLKVPEGANVAQGASLRESLGKLYLQDVDVQDVDVNDAGQAYQATANKSEKDRAPRELDQKADDWYQLWCAAHGKDAKQLDSVVAFLDEARAKTETVERSLWGHFWPLLATHVPDDQVKQLIDESNRMLTQDGYESFMTTSAAIIPMWPILVLSLIVYGLLRATGFFKSHGVEHRGMEGRARRQQLIDKNGYIDTDELFKDYEKLKRDHLGLPSEVVEAVVDDGPQVHAEQIVDEAYDEARLARDAREAYEVKKKNFGSKAAKLMGFQVDEGLGDAADALAKLSESHRRFIALMDHGLVDWLDLSVSLMSGETVSADWESIQSDLEPLFEGNPQLKTALLRSAPESFGQVEDSARPAKALPSGPDSPAGSTTGSDTDDSGQGPESFSPLGRNSLHGASAAARDDLSTQTQRVEDFLALVVQLPDDTQLAEGFYQSCAMAWVAARQAELRDRPHGPGMVATPS